MTGLPEREGTGERSLVGSGLYPKVQVAMGAGMGVAIALAAVWANVLATTVLLVPGTTTALPEAFWWAVSCGVVVACGLATPVAWRLWRLGVEGLGESGHDRNQILSNSGSTPTVIAGSDERRAERQLLEAIDPHGEITPARAALETPLTVAEADRMLSDLAHGGHLEVRAEGGKLLYGL